MIPSFRPYNGKVAANYDSGRVGQDKWIAEAAAVERFLPLSAGLVLDVPVGTGRFGDLCRCLGRPLLGMDVSEDMMAIARSRGIECRYGSALDIPLPDQSVATVLSLRLLYWMEPHERTRALAEFRRVATTDLVLGSPPMPTPPGWRLLDMVEAAKGTTVYHLAVA